MKWLDLDVISFNEVYELVLDASRKAFRDIQTAHPNETFYAFGFYQEYWLTQFRFMLPACHSEESHMRLNNLTEIDQDQQTLEWFYRRWQPAQWEYLYSGQEHFLPAWQWVNNNLDGYVRPRDQELLKAMIDYNMIDVYLKVLSVLDSENLFGHGIARENVVLTLSFCPEAEHPRAYECEYTRSLNPTSTYERWRIEMELGQHAQQFFNPPPRFDDDFDPDVDEDFDLESE